MRGRGAECHHMWVGIHRSQESLKKGLALAALQNWLSRQCANDEPDPSNHPTGDRVDNLAIDGSQTPSKKLKLVPRPNLESSLTLSYNVKSQP